MQGLKQPRFSPVTVCTSSYKEAYSCKQCRFQVLYFSLVCRSYLCISAYMWLYLYISVYIREHWHFKLTWNIWSIEQRIGECRGMQLEGIVFTESHTAKGNSLVKQERWHGLRARSYCGPGVQVDEKEARALLAQAAVTLPDPGSPSLRLLQTLCSTRKHAAFLFVIE